MIWRGGTVVKVGATNAGRLVGVNLAADRVASFVAVGRRFELCPLRVGVLLSEADEFDVGSSSVETKANSRTKMMTGPAASVNHSPAFTRQGTLPRVARQ
jgi:hypothetical protein